MSRFIDRLLEGRPESDEERQPLRMQNLPGGIGWLVIIVVIGVYLLTGIYTVGSSEVGLVKRFGRYTATVNPGLHYHLPAPIESVSIVNVLQVRKEEIGFRTISPAPNPRYQIVEIEALMLTGDGNIAHVEMVVQYRVKDAQLFAFNLIDASALVKQGAEAVLREQVATKTLDQTLTERWSRCRCCLTAMGRGSWWGTFSFRT